MQQIDRAVYRSLYDFREAVFDQLKDKPKGTGLRVGPGLYAIIHNNDLLGVELDTGKNVYDDTIRMANFDSAFTFEYEMWNDVWVDEWKRYVGTPILKMVPGYLEFITANVQQAAAESTSSPGYLATVLMSELGLDFGNSADLDDQWANFYEKTRNGHLLEIRDKNGVLLKEGDVVVGLRSMPKGDYLPKGFPPKIRILFRVIWNAQEGKYALQEIGFHPEDKQFGEARFYRVYDHQMVVRHLRNEQGIAMGNTYDPSMICANLEVYEQPEPV